MPLITDFSNLIESVNNGSYLFFVGDAQLCKLFNECFIDMLFCEHFSKLYRALAPLSGYSLFTSCIYIMYVYKDLWAVGINLEPLRYCALVILTNSLLWLLICVTSRP